MYCVFFHVLQIEYSFKWLQAPITAKKTYDDLKSLKYQPLPALNVRNFISQVYIQIISHNCYVVKFYYSRALPPMK